ncbi:HicB family protein (modular protein) [Mesorhizobium plurifarium]|uniref:HicB family protein (Modular protein) n=1 Tax=Mesorhizobium plurifarium TaxID=69974 RepID=A0A090E9W3_MESPL|nr:HicB family protein (modular protein) [Mesorhizobium plurifarium]
MELIDAGVDDIRFNINKTEAKRLKPYKGYLPVIEFDEGDMVFHGRVAGLRDIFTFEATTAEDLVKSFHDSVDDYLAFCAEKGREPEKPHSGKIALRIPPATHRLVAMAAEADDKSINQWMADTLETAVRDRETRIRIKA